MSRSKRKKMFSYDVDDPMDRGIVLDLPFEQLNAKGRRAKKKKLKIMGMR